MIGTMQPKVLGEFYTKILGEPTMADGEWYGWLVGNAFLSVGAHSEVKGESKEPQRVIFNFDSDDVKGEAERIKGLGAKVIKEAYEIEGMWIATFADPDGNYFQITTPWKPK